MVKCVDCDKLERAGPKSSPTIGYLRKAQSHLGGTILPIDSVQLNVTNDVPVQIKYPKIEPGLTLFGLDFVEPLVGVFRSETWLDMLRWVTAVCFIGIPKASAVFPLQSSQNDVFIPEFDPDVARSLFPCAKMRGHFPIR